MSHCSINRVLGILGCLTCLVFQANAQISADNYQVYGVRPEPGAEVVLDGRLDEAIWSRVSSMGEFHFMEQIDSRTPERQTVVKVFYTEDFSMVVQGCPVPVILAGGPRNLDVLTMARNAVNCGVKGFAFGRNIFQSEDPVKLIAELDGIIRG